MKLVAIEHVQLAMPTGEEDRARAFYGAVLELQEIPKPPHLAKRGGVWFESGAVKLHLGVDKDFKAATKAHVALLVEGLPELVARCKGGGYAVAADEPLEGFDRVYVTDPFGNRIELMEPK
jgi:catechol 2,3-dioxygenase-like lactoylglutathione lyase family enzyme